MDFPERDKPPRERSVARAGGANESKGAERKDEEEKGTGSRMRRISRMRRKEEEEARQARRREMLSSVNDRSIDARRRHTPASFLPSASSPRELSISPPSPASTVSWSAVTGGREG